MSSGGKGNSKSKTDSTTSTTTNQTTTNTVDNRAVEGDNAAIGGNVTFSPSDSQINGDINVSTTDQGAIRAGLDLALEALNSVNMNNQQTDATLKSVTSDSISQAYSLADQARQSETSAALNNFLKYGLYIAIAGIAAYALIKYKK